MRQCLEADTIAIVPVKRFDQAKSRLAARLSKPQRNQLAVAMLHDTLSVLSQVNAVKQIIVVTCDDMASAIAQDYGATTVLDRKEAGTNAAIIQGIDALSAHSGAAVMLPTDLPCLTPMNVNIAVGALTNAHCAIAATTDGGTAILALRQIHSMRTAFGPNSFRLHVAAAQEAKLTLMRIALKRGFQDLDTPEDITALKRYLPFGRTRQVLALSA